MEIERYTLEESRVMIRREDCLTTGHVLDVHLDDNKDPYTIGCCRCGRGWVVYMEKDTSPYPPGRVVPPVEVVDDGGS